MPDTYTIPQDYIQVHWKEMYVSNAVNRFFAGHLQVGVWRGFVASNANPIVNFAVDGTWNDSVATCEDADGYALNCRLTSTVAIDFTGKAIGTWYVVMGLSYDLNLATSGLILIKDYASIVNTDIILAKVTITTSPGNVTAVDQTPRVNSGVGSGKSVPVHDSIYPKAINDPAVNIGSKNAVWFSANLYSVNGYSNGSVSIFVTNANAWYNPTTVRWEYVQGTVGTPHFAARNYIFSNSGGAYWEWDYAVAGKAGDPITWPLVAMQLVYQSPMDFYLMFWGKQILPHTDNNTMLGQPTQSWLSIHSYNYYIYNAAGTAAIYNSGGAIVFLPAAASRVVAGYPQDVVDLGSVSQRWRTLYGISISLDTGTGVGHAGLFWIDTTNTFRVDRSFAPYTPFNKTLGTTTEPWSAVYAGQVSFYSPGPVLQGELYARTVAPWGVGIDSNFIPDTDGGRYLGDSTRRFYAYISRFYDEAGYYINYDYNSGISRFFPSADGGCDLGYSSFRFRNLWVIGVATDLIPTSDGNTLGSATGPKRWNAYLYNAYWLSGSSAVFYAGSTISPNSPAIANCGTATNYWDVVYARGIWFGGTGDVTYHDLWRSGSDVVLGGTDHGDLNFIPKSTNAADLGGPSNGWRNVYISGSVIQVAGYQETGYCGIEGISAVVAATHGYGVNFKTKMTNTPSSITLSAIGRQNCDAGWFSIRTYGFLFEGLTPAATIYNWYGTYVTVGN